MKKVILTVTLITAITLSTRAQVYVQGGLNLANITKTNDGQTEKNNILPSFNVGILGRLELDPMFDLESGFINRAWLKGRNLFYKWQLYQIKV